MRPVRPAGSQALRSITPCVLRLPLFGVGMHGIVGSLQLRVPLRAGGGAHGGQLPNPPCPKGLGPLMLQISDARHPSLLIRVPNCPLVPAHHVDKKLSVLLTPFLNASLRLILLSFPLCSFLSMGNMLIL